MPDIEKLRRFSLAAALVLIFYTSAGISLESGAKASILGIPFIIDNPDLLFVGLLFASIYGMVRYYYYAIMLRDSPYRQRRKILRNLVPEDWYKKNRNAVYSGSIKYSTSPMDYEYSNVERELQLVIESFPKVGAKGVYGKIKSHRGCDDDGEPYTVYYAEITIPTICRMSALAQDIDYTAPVWANIISFIMVVIL